MSDGDEKLSGAEEYVAVGIDLAEEIGPAREKSIRAAVAKQEGIQKDSLGMRGKKVTLSYDPTRISSDEVTRFVRQTGVQPMDVETARASVTAEEP